MSTLRIDVEPVLHPPENVSIEQIIRDRYDECMSSKTNERQEGGEDEVDQDEEGASWPITNPEFDVLPMKSHDAYDLQKRATFSMTTNEALHCRWHSYVMSLHAGMNPVTFPTPKDYLFRFYKHQHKRNIYAQDIRRTLKPVQGVLYGRPTPVPTQPCPPYKPIDPKKFLKRKSVAFAGVSKPTNPILCKDFGVQIYRNLNGPAEQK